MKDTLEILEEIIRSRRSIYPQSYTGEEIPRQTVSRILESANYAPSHKLTQPWRFRVFRKAGLEKLADELGRLYRESTPESSFLPSKYEATREKVLQSSCVIAIILKTHPDKLPEWEELASVACAVQNMWLTATASGVGSYWSSPGFLASLGPFLELGPEEKCIGIFYMGYTRDIPPATKRSPVDEKVTWIES